MSQLPDGTLGDAVGVLIFTFICLFTNILLLWLFWISNEQLGCEFSLILIPIPNHIYYFQTNRYSSIDIALVGYFALLCTLSSIIQQIYNYT